MFHVTTKVGQLQVDDTTVQIVAPFKKVVWSVPHANITGISQQVSGNIAVDLTIYTTQGTYTAPYVPKRKISDFFALFPDIIVQPLGSPWYDDSNRLTYVATYTNEQEMQRDVEAAAHQGWMPQNTAGTSGHINVGRTATAAVLTGGFSLLLGASRSKDKITMTFVRTPEWMAQHR